MHVPTIIERKRDGKALDEGEIRFVVRAFTDGLMPDYQMSAFAMAVYFQGMDAGETAALTRAMLESGTAFRWPEHAPPRRRQTLDRRGGGQGLARARAPPRLR
jgi:thymidine phosphorylase